MNANFGRPEWLPELDSFASMFEAYPSRIHAPTLIAGASEVCLKLVLTGEVDNFGEIQRTLQDIQSLLQLVAEPFDPNIFSQPRVVCIDVLTNQPRDHQLTVAFGLESVDRLFQMHAIDHETNLALLAHSTGVLAIG